MLTKAVVFLFCVIAVFAVIVSNVPADFSVPTWTTPTQKVVTGYFSKANYTLYTSTASGNMSLAAYPYAKTGIPTTISPDDTLELYWEDGYIASPFGATDIGPVIHMNHATKQWGGWYISSHQIDFTLSNGKSPSVAPPYITYDDIVADWNLTGNSDCLFQGSCAHLTVSLVLAPNNTAYTMMDAWHGYTDIEWYLSYQVNMNGTSMSIWTLLAELFSFQSLNLGMGGLADSMISGCVSAFMFALVVIVIYKITTGLIPWISGGSGD
jgi:hypothetical protein